MPDGLSTSEAVKQQLLVGRNEIVSSRSVSPLALFLSQFPSFINGVLFIAALFSFFIGHMLDGIFIISVLLLNALFGFIQEFRAEKALEKLKEYTITAVRVFRDGKQQQIPTTDLVPGDLVLLSEGDRVPADGKLTTTNDMEVDESILTGESIAVTKPHGADVFFGTLVIKGNGRLHVEQTGMQTRFGKIAHTLTDLETDKTPLEKQLNTLGKVLTILIVIIAACLIPIGHFQQQPLFTMLLLAVSIAIAAIPQGLPAVVTVALAIGTNRMAHKKAIVRKMSAVETLGAVQVILVDKTGTLTQNEMRVKRHWLTQDDHLEKLLDGCFFGNTASLIQKADTNTYDVVGDKTDGALLLYAHQHIHDPQAFRKQGKIIEEYPFDSETKMITTVLEKNDARHIFVRGAPEMVLEKSTASEEHKKIIMHEIETFAKEGLRVIGFASKHAPDGETLTRSHMESDLTFLGLIGIYDPPRPEAAQAVQEAKNAGIKTVMVTGDNEHTATTIAKEVGLIEENEDVITGDELEKISDEELDRLLLKTRIFARSKPEDKLRLVEAYKRLGYVVGVTGDGVNDALALKRADVGIAMGAKGTDVAKEAADIIITDDNFSTLVKAVEEGRTIYKNIVKAVTYLLTGNVSELSLVVFAALSGNPTLLLPTQILWINLVTDAFPAMALASDNKDPHVLSQKPRNPKTPILTGKRTAFIMGFGILLSFFFLMVFSILSHRYSPTVARTAVFNVLILSHMALSFVVRDGTWLSVNKLLLLAVWGIILAQLLITTVPFFQEIFQLTILS